MKRAATLFVALLAALVLLHVGLPHSTGDRSGTTAASAGGLHTSDDSSPTSPHVVHVADADQAGLPDRSPSADHDIFMCPARVAAVPSAAGPEPVFGLRSGDVIAASTPDPADLGVFRC